MPRKIPYDNKTYEDRLFSKCIPEPNSGCWLWVGALVLPGGYGYMAFKGKNTLAHRISYILKHGDIPEGPYVCHKCDVKCCINPDHLFLGTNAENIHDSFNKRGSWWQVSGEASPHSKLTEDQVRSIRSQRASGKTQKELSRQFGVSQVTILKIARREKWAHVK